VVPLWPSAAGRGRVESCRRARVGLGEEVLVPREHVFEIDASKALAEQPETGHNRWHEAIGPVVEVDPGDSVVFETRDAFDGQFGPSSTGEVAAARLGPVHPLTGPVFVRGQSRGTCLRPSWFESIQIRGTTGATRLRCRGSAFCATSSPPVLRPLAPGGRWRRLRAGA